MLNAVWLVNYFEVTYFVMFLNQDFILSKILLWSWYCLYFKRFFIHVCSMASCLSELCSPWPARRGVLWVPRNGVPAVPFPGSVMRITPQNHGRSSYKQVGRVRIPFSLLENRTGWLRMWQSRGHAAHRVSQLHLW